MTDQDEGTPSSSLHSDRRTDTLGRRLYEAGYTEPRLRQLWGPAIAGALVRNNAAPAIHFCSNLLKSGDRSFEVNLAALAMLFHFHQDVRADVLTEALGADFIALARDIGLLETRTDVLTAPFAVTAYDVPVGVPRGMRPGDENLYLVSDHGTLVNPGVLNGDFVLGLGGAGRTLVSLTPRDRVGLAADIGTGCGIQAFLLARHSDRVIASDVSERALRLAEIGAGINGLTNIEFRQGSLLEPLEEKVDLLVSNPPFVITPRAEGGALGSLPDFEYRDGGMAGDRLVRSLFAAIPGVLGPGGRAVCLGNWEVVEAAETGAGPAEWVHDRDTSVFVIEREVVDPIAYAETWIRDGGIPRAGSDWNTATAAWVEDFESRDVAEIVFGYVLMHKLDNDFRTFDRSVAEKNDNGAFATGQGTFKTTVRTTSAVANNPHGIGQFLDTVFELRSWLHGADSEELAETAYRRSPDLVEHRHFVPGQSDPTSITLEQGIGFGQVFDLDTALAGFVSVADGTLTLRQTAAALAQLLEVNVTALEDQLIAQVRQLVAAGALLPVSAEESD